MRHSATRALLERDDVIVVASVSCIYGIGDVETYSAMAFSVKKGERIRPAPASRRSRGASTTSAMTAISSAAPSACAAIRSSSSPRISRIAPGASRFFGDEIESISEFDPLTGQKAAELEQVKIYSNSHYVTPKPTLEQAVHRIKRRPCESASPNSMPPAACSKPSASSSAPSSTSK